MICFKKTISPTVGETVPEGGMFITSGILILVLRALYIQILAYCTVQEQIGERLDSQKPMSNVVILKKITCKGTLRQVFYVSDALSPSTVLRLTHTLPPLHTVLVYVYTDSILIHTGKGERGGELPREKVRGAGRKYQHD